MRLTPRGCGALALHCRRQAVCHPQQYGAIRGRASVPYIDEDDNAGGGGPVAVLSVLIIISIKSGPSANNSQPASS